ncbi:hypothetical protein [Gilliamella sp. Bif1-4]|uniref:hypothetical protein n=1 Tax=Gilliamella sp. Bif1-4 TaxID=3120233 RepID=UPI00080DFAB0|nr:hypothetical protein [Gilliamella apicola]OCG40555.1 hypothetical protein A9G25_07610 [Gilliamella apicola]OCG40824.1 hypothetical protein A9G25_00320 [Gilliamella apicola]
MIDKNFIDFLLSTNLDDNDFLKKYYLNIHVSYFDHFLDEDEYYNTELIAYVDAIKDPKKLNLFNSIEQKFVNFYKKLYELSNKKVSLYNDEGKIAPIDSYNKFNHYILDAMKEKTLCTIVFPSLELFTLTGFDLTHSFFILKHDCEQEFILERKIEAIANSIGLHVI